MRDAILTLIRAAVADSLTDESPADDRSTATRGVRMEWPKRSAPSGSIPREPGDAGRGRGPR